jgi:oleate hydratase
VPEVFGSIYDVRELIKSTAFLRDREKLSIPFFVKKYVDKTIIGRLLEEYGVL